VNNTSIRNVAACVRERLHQHAQKRGKDFQPKRAGNDWGRPSWRQKVNRGDKLYDVR
jgi:hypothetical protein